MRWVLIILGALATLIGIVWILQGINILLGSFMSGQSFWALMGVVALVIGLVLLYVGGRRMGPRMRP